MLCEKTFKPGEMVCKEAKIGPGLSKPTLAEELAACGEVSSFSSHNQQRAPTSRLARAMRARLGILHKTEYRRKAPVKSRKSPDKKSSL